MTPFIILMGVSGSGKTTVGRELAGRLGWRFFDADDFHPAQNVAKMQSGQPLSDADRQPWLQRLQNLIVARLAAGKPSLLAASALKQQHRRMLAVDDRVQFVYLRGDFELIYDRMQQRSDHYFKAELLRSQFAALEAPQQALTVDIAQPVAAIVDEIITRLALQPANQKRS